MSNKNYRINAKMRRGKKAPSAQVVTLQGSLIREARKFALLVLCCAIPGYLYILSLPEAQKLDNLRESLVSAEVSKKVSEQKNDRIMREISAFKSNPEYLEIIARDHLDLCKQGETIVRILR